MSTKTFVGLDIGSNFIKASYVTENGVPKPLLFANQQTQVPSVAVLNEGGNVHWVGQEACDHAFNLPDGFQIEENLKSRLQNGERSAEAGLRALIDKFHEQLAAKEFDDIQTLHEDEFQTWLGGTPSDNRVQNNSDALLKLVGDAGFPNVHQGSPYEAAALAFWAEKKLKVYKNTPTQILVADFSGQQVRLTVLEWLPSAQKFSVVLQNSIPWGGDRIDQSLLDGWLLPRYVENASTLDTNQRAGLRHLARGLKQELSTRLKQGSTRASLGTRFAQGNLLNANRIEITQAEFETVDLVRSAFRDLKELMLQVCKSEALIANADYVLLVGGGANCYFTQRLAQKIWGEEKILMVDKPEMAIVKGLSLMGSGQSIIEANKPQVDVSPPYRPSPEPIIAPPPPLPASDEVDQRRKSAGNAINKAIVIGVVITLIVSVFVLPGIASFFLIALEYWLVQKIAKIYGNRLTGGMQWFVLVALLGMSFALKTAIEALLTIGLVTCILKPVVSALVIWGIGELTIYAFSSNILSKYR